MVPTTLGYVIMQQEKPGKQLQRQRWYDDIGEMTLALHLVRQLPPEIQSVVTRNLSAAIDDCRRLRRQDRDSISLGLPRVLGLYKASARKRWFDQNPAMQRAFNLMSTVPDGYLTQFADCILKVNDYLGMQQEVVRFGASGLLSDTVDGILQEAVLRLEEGRDGIRLVAEKDLPSANQSGNILTFHPNKSPGPR